MLSYNFQNSQLAWLMAILARNSEKESHLEVHQLGLVILDGTCAGYAISNLELLLSCNLGWLTFGFQI